MSTAMIAWPGDSSAAPLGGKAGALVALVDAQLPIPPFFTITGAAFMASLTPEQLQIFTTTRNVEEIQTLLLHIQPDATVVAELLTAYDRLCADGSPVAVRSSAQDEDSAGHSFAGQLDSFLFVTRPTFLEKVAAVWRSAFSQRIIAYRHEHGLPLTPQSPAVLVQKMIDADVAGVAFAADPVSGQRGVAVVSAVLGLGSALVSGEADADTFTIDRTGKLLSRVIAQKQFRHVRDVETSEGVRAVPVEPALASAPALRDDQARAVAGLARATSRHFGRPQDIEWALQSGRLYLLQSRPITSLNNTADPDSQLQIWDNSNIAESYAGITTPLTFTFARHAYEGVYKEFCRLMGVPQAVITDHHTMFANMLGLIRGRVYYNLLNWYRMLALLPGFTVNRTFMEQMMGVKEGLPENLVRELSAATWQAKVRDTFRLVRTIGGLMANHFTLQRHIKDFYRRLEVALAPHDPPLDLLRPDELVAYFRALERQLLSRWDAPLVNDFFAMIFYGVLRKQCGRIDPRGTLQNDLLCAEGGIISMEPAKRIRAMATLILGQDDLVTLLSIGQRRAIEQCIRDFPQLEQQYHSYLEKFGHRCLEELKLESATLHDDPLPLFRSIGGLAQRMQASSALPPDVDVQLRAQAQRRVQVALRFHPLRRIVFHWVLRHARARVRDRENLRFERTRVFGRCRQIFVELGRRFHADGLLGQPRDIFYLNIEDILGFVEGTATCTDLAALAALRCSEFERYRSAPPPADRFETRGPVYNGNTYSTTGTSVKATTEGECRTGIGCCPGTVRGPARVITDPRGAQIKHGEILIAARTDPGWIMLFPAAAGVAVEFGSILSHSAIVAREMGIPAVVSVSGLTAWLKTGDLVELDGQAGTVCRLAPEATA